MEMAAVAVLWWCGADVCTSVSVGNASPRNVLLKGCLSPAVAFQPRLAHLPTPLKAQCSPGQQAGPSSRYALGGCCTLQRPSALLRPCSLCALLAPHDRAVHQLGNMWEPAGHSAWAPVHAHSPREGAADGGDRAHACRAALPSCHQPPPRCSSSTGSRLAGRAAGPPLVRLPSPVHEAGAIGLVHLPLSCELVTKEVGLDACSSEALLV